VTQCRTHLLNILLPFLELGCTWHMHRFVCEVKLLGSRELMKTLARMHPRSHAQLGMSQCVVGSCSRTSSNSWFRRHLLMQAKNYCYQSKVCRAKQCAGISLHSAYPEFNNSHNDQAVLIFQRFVVVLPLEYLSPARFVVIMTILFIAFTTLPVDPFSGFSIRNENNLWRSAIGEINKQKD
jgi:hypothetical protein